MFIVFVDGDIVVMKYVSFDGEEGFLGEVMVEFIFWLMEENELILGYIVIIIKFILVNLLNYVYFNLVGYVRILILLLVFI